MNTEQSTFTNLLERKSTKIFKITAKFMAYLVTYCCLTECKQSDQLFSVYLRCCWSRFSRQFSPNLPSLIFPLEFLLQSVFLCGTVGRTAVNCLSLWIKLTNLAQNTGCAKYSWRKMELVWTRMSGSFRIRGGLWRLCCTRIVSSLVCYLLTGVITSAWILTLSRPLLTCQRRVQLFAVDSHFF